MSNSGHFRPGNKAAKGAGRPAGSKNQIEPIRRRILRIVKRRVMKEKDLESVSTGELLKFLASIMPKDAMSIQAPQINYISNVPRETIIESVSKINVDEIPTQPVPQLSEEIIPEEKKEEVVNESLQRD
jgi:hypothetical protein